MEYAVLGVIFIVGIVTMVGLCNYGVKKIKSIK